MYFRCTRPWWSCRRHWARDPEDLALLHGEGHVVHGHGVAVALVHVLYLDDRWHAPSSPVWHRVRGPASQSEVSAASPARLCPGEYPVHPNTARHALADYELRGVGCLHVAPVHGSDSGGGDCVGVERRAQPDRGGRADIGPAEYLGL